MRRTSVVWASWTLALALPATAAASPLLTLRHDGTTVVREDPYLPPAGELGAEVPSAGAERSRAGAHGASAGAERSRAGAHGASAGAERSRPARRGAGAEGSRPGERGTGERSRLGARGLRAAAPGGAARAAASKRTARSELARMLAAGAIDQATHDARLATVVDARKLLHKLGGTRRAALGAVLANLEAVAARGDLNVSRLPALFETVARNRQWWANGRLLSYGQRVSFQGSPLVWQYYTGEGLQIQWLGTFGKANALWKSRTHDDDLHELLDAALALAAQRAGGIAFEYLFDFDGGRPPWVSGLAQGTGIQALSRAAIRLAEPRYFEAARSALGIFRTAPPSGVRIATPAGAHYLIYSFAPGMRVLNGFTQALNGLHDFALLANDIEGHALFTAGEAQLRVELPAYDTGAWSRYSLRSDADLSYHKLARDFLVNLCTRLEEDAGRAASGAAITGSPGGGAAAGSAQTGGAVPVAPPAPPAAPLADPAPYCAAAKRFTSYLSQPPVVALVSQRARAGRPAALRLTLSKPSYVKLAVVRGGRTFTVLAARLGSGRRSLLWSHPRAGKGYEVQLRATDLAGNVATAKGKLEVLKRRR